MFRLITRSVIVLLVTLCFVANSFAASTERLDCKDATLVALHKKVATRRDLAHKRESIQADKEAELRALVSKQKVVTFSSVSAGIISSLALFGYGAGLSGLAGISPISAGGMAGLYGTLASAAILADGATTPQLERTAELIVENGFEKLDVAHEHLSRDFAAVMKDIPDRAGAFGSNDLSALLVMREEALYRKELYNAEAKLADSLLESLRAACRQERPAAAFMLAFSGNNSGKNEADPRAVSDRSGSKKIRADSAPSGGETEQSGKSAKQAR